MFSETDGNDATYFVINQLKMIRMALDDLYEYLDEKSAELGDVEKAVRNRAGLNPRQLAVLGHALRHPEAEFTVDAHQKSHAVSYETARSDLLALVDAGFLESAKDGKKLVFTPASRMDRKLKR